jgi:multidrug efflux pump subunit AcrA (membrane-fusion protein)
VEVSGVHQGQWVVAKGLKKGERVVVEGTQKVRDGILVELQEAGAPKGGNTLISRFCTNGSVQ